MTFRRPDVLNGGVEKTRSLHERASGILLHPTSLPSRHGIGDLGPEAHAFLDFLGDAAQGWWQMLPVGPVGLGSSPYSSPSTFAGSARLLSLEVLSEEGLLEPKDLEGGVFPAGRTDYALAQAFKEERLRRAFDAHQAAAPGRRELTRFRDERRDWLEDWALFAAVKRTRDERPWWEWEEDLRSRSAAGLERARRELGPEVDYHAFLQLLFARQWGRLRERARERRVGLIGDVPIFVALDSADVWANAELFDLLPGGHPRVVAGVPPDYFSATGQRWGNPLYRWPVLAERGFDWWLKRLSQAFARFDAVRLDHFIGFVRYWEIDASCETAVEGRWQPGPGRAFFDAVRARLGEVELIAEDLGSVTPEVRALRDAFDLPGMRVLQFAWGKDDTYQPHSYLRRTVVYTGTHDNDTTQGWFQGDGLTTKSQAARREERRVALAYMDSDGREVHWDLIRLALMSVAETAIFPAQDLLGLGTRARFNRPGVAGGNWEWRLRRGQLGGKVARRLAALTRLYGRAQA